MIFDWRMNGDRVAATGELTLDDAWARSRVWTQEVNFARHAKYGLGWPDHRIRDALLSLRGGTAESFSYDPDEAASKVDSIMGEAKAMGPLPPLPRVTIWASEARYLDSLSAPRDVKAYWVAIMVYVKSKRAMRERAVRDPAVERWAYSRAGLVGKASNIRKRVDAWSRRCGIPFPLSVSTGSSFYPVPGWFASSDPDGAAATASLSEGEGLPTWVFRPRSFTCPECGARFDRPPKARTPLCGVCAARKRARDAAERKRRQRKKQM